MRNILIFGTGYATERMEKVINEQAVNILAYIDNDKNKQGNLVNGKKIISVDEINKYEYDYIIVGSTYYEEIKEQLKDINIDDNKIINYYSIDDTIYDPRIASLKLVAEEIYNNNISGSIAELGVYRGEFAKNINKMFPDRKFYLFDTFEGFKEEDILVEEKQKFSHAKVSQYGNTSVDLVLNKMPQKENCIIKKGYFPESAEGVDDVFAFVSLDVDLYKPTYEGLKYFYDRLSKGGYIFVHDYGNKSYSGVKKAVTEFITENDAKYFPLCDTHLSVVIIK